MALQECSQTVEVGLIRKYVIGYSVRIAHGDAEERDFMFVQWQMDDVGFRGYGNFRGNYAGRAHIHGDAGNLPVQQIQSQRFDACQRLYSHGISPADTIVIDELAEAANAVAAHFRLAAIAVEDAHPRIRAIGGQSQDEAVAANAKAPVGQAPRQKVQTVRQGLMKAVYDDKVVSYAVHFGEFQNDRHLLNMPATI